MENLNIMNMIEHPDYVNGMNRLALRLLNNNQKVYTISSLQEGEGKTSVAYNLALALIKLQKKVCFVETDMLTKENQDFKNSLPSFLSGDNELNQFINKHNEFDTITSSYSDSSVTLLSSVRFSQMIEQLREEYDFVLFDAPSLDTHVDAMLISQKSDALILVVEEGRNGKDDLEDLLLNLKRNNITLLGTVLNKISNPKSLNFKANKR